MWKSNWIPRNARTLTFLNLIFASKRGIVTNSRRLLFYCAPPPLLRSEAHLIDFQLNGKKIPHLPKLTLRVLYLLWRAEAGGIAAKRRFLRIFFMQILGSEPIFAWLLKSFFYSINSESVWMSVWSTKIGIISVKGFAWFITRGTETQKEPKKKTTAAKFCFCQFLVVSIMHSLADSTKSKV